MNRIGIAAATVSFLVLLMTGCGSDDGAGDAVLDGGTVAAGTEVTEDTSDGATVTDPTTPTLAPGATEPEPATSDVEPGPRLVVLVEADDVLNIRAAAGTGNDIVATLDAGAETAITGARATVGQSIWYEVQTADGTGWANGRYLAASVTDEAFADDEQVSSLLERLVAVMRERGDLTTVASERGIYVSYYDEPELFPSDALDEVLGDPTPRRWSSPAGDDGLFEFTFAEAVADSIVSTWEDPDRSVAVDRPLAGPSARPPEAALPFTLRQFHFVSVFDSGDDPTFDGLDWTSWHISIDYEDDEPVVVGLTIDRWVP